MGVKNHLQKHIAKLAIDVIGGKGAVVVRPNGINEFKDFFDGVFLQRLVFMVLSKIKTPW